MKMNFRIATISAALMLIASLAFSAEGEQTEKAAPTFKNQTHCPVMGGKIDSTVFTDIQGQRVYHCCPGCIKPLKEDPDKYFKKADAERIIFENIQTQCPVSGEELEEKKVSTYFEGRTVYFCCEKCIGEFKKDPNKYLQVMDKPTSGKAETPEGDNH